MLAAFIMAHDGLSALDTIHRVREARPGSVETREQEIALELFEKYLEAQNGEMQLLNLIKEVTRSKVQ